MIKVIGDKCTIEGPKVEVITELQIATHYLLKHIDTMDKFILLNTITDIINKSIKENVDNE